MHLQLVDRNIGLCNEWEKLFSSEQYVSIHCADFFSLETDCIVSPANSFGFMDGGLDYAISRTLGWQVQERVQEKIRNEFHGELLVGQALLVETGNEKIPYLISAPTMRVPLILTNTVNVYLASKAVFRVVKENPQIKTVTMSGLGTGVGQVPYDICAKQIYWAYRHEYLEEYKFPENWMDAKKLHDGLFRNIE
ncbi:hypothetical protein GYB22_03515 [bacterium]|nr:hypothetical protein [bacterium]